MDKKEYAKAYYQAHKEELRERAKIKQRDNYGQKQKCEACDCEILKHRFTTHMRSQKHKRNTAIDMMKTIDDKIEKEITERKKTRKRIKPKKDLKEK